MKPRLVAALTVIVMLTLSSVMVNQAFTRAQQQPAQLQYSVKFVCGPSPAQGQNSGLVAAGRYFTAINVHNPSNYQLVSFRKKFAVALPKEKVGPVSPFFKTEIGPDQALEIDCADIYSHLNMNPNSFVKGFVVIQSPRELDVVPVYTAAGSSGQVETVDVERVAPARFTPCGRLDMNLNTGTAPWTVVRPGATTTSPVHTFNTPPHAFWATPPNPNNTTPPPRWISSQSNASDINGPYRYELCFCLCAGFENAQLSLQVLAVDAVTVSLNGTTIMNVAAPAYLTPTSWNLTNASLLKPGQNCLIAMVNNISQPPGNSPTGLAVAGRLTADGGQCPATGPGPGLEQ